MVTLKVSPKRRIKTLKISTLLTWVTRLKSSPLGKGHLVTTMEKSSPLVEGHMATTKRESSPLGGGHMATNLAKDEDQHALSLSSKVI